MSEKQIKNFQEKILLEQYEKSLELRDPKRIGLTFYKNVKNPSEKLQIEIMKKDPNNFPCIPNPTKNIQLMAVKHNGLFIKNIKKPSKKMIEEAIKQNPDAAKLIKK